MDIQSGFPARLEDEYSAVAWSYSRPLLCEALLSECPVWSPSAIFEKSADGLGEEVVTMCQRGRGRTHADGSSRTTVPTLCPVHS